MLNYLKSSSTGNFFLLAGPCVIEGEEMALDIAETIANITARLTYPTYSRAPIAKPIAHASTHSPE